MALVEIHVHPTTFAFRFEDRTKCRWSNLRQPVYRIEHFLQTDRMALWRS